MLDKWLSGETSEIGLVLLSGIIVYAAILLYTRMAGLRSFSKMSAADFAMTIAVGSIFGATISSPKPRLTSGLTALAFLFVAQWLIAYLRRRVPFFRKLMDNRPVLLMKDGKILQKNADRVNVTKADIFSKLREANVKSLDRVTAVVFETTGNVSVLYSDDKETSVSSELLYGVQDLDRPWDPN